MGTPASEPAGRSPALRTAPAQPAPRPSRVRAATPCGKSGPQRGCAGAAAAPSAVWLSCPLHAGRRASGAVSYAAHCALRSLCPRPAAHTQRLHAAGLAAAAARVHRRALPRCGSVVRAARRPGRGPAGRSPTLRALRTAHGVACAPAQPCARSDPLRQVPRAHCGCRAPARVHRQPLPRCGSLVRFCVLAGRPAQQPAALSPPPVWSGGSGCRMFSEAPPPSSGGGHGRPRSPGPRSLCGW